MFLKAKMLLLTLVVYIHFAASKRAVIKLSAKNSVRKKKPHLFVMYASAL
jgi:hypothetical protein